MRKPLSTATGRTGVNFVRSVVEGANCLFHEVGTSSDFGVDAFVELVDNEEMTGIVLAFQIKSGSSYVSEQTCTIPGSMGHFDYWAKLSVPVIGVVFDPPASVAYWIDISGYLASRGIPVTAAPFSITFDKSPFSQFDYATFERRFLRPDVDSEDQSLDEALAAANSSELSRHVRGMRLLLRHHRTRTEAWDVFVHYLRTAPIGGTSVALIQQVSFVLGNPDLFARSDDLVPGEVEEHVRRQVRAFDETDAAKLLSRVESDNGFSRGSIGQAVEIILRAHPRREDLIKAVVENEKLADETRMSALLLLVRFDSPMCRPYLAGLSGVDGGLGAWAEELLRHLESHDQLN